LLPFIFLFLSILIHIYAFANSKKIKTLSVTNAILLVFTIVNISIANVLELYYALLAGNKIHKIDINNLRKCSELSKSETDELTQLAGTLSGQTAAIASEQCAIFFSNIPETSILCQDASKEFESNNTVR